MEDRDVIKAFEDNGAMLKGHFLLTSGRHSDKYLQCALVTQHPDLCAKLAGEIAAKLPKGKVDVSIGPAMGGITLAYEVGRALGSRAIFAEREEGRMTLRRGFSLNPGEKVVVCEDVVTTGGSAKEVADMAREAGCDVVGIACLVDRSGGKANLGYPLYSVLKMEVLSWTAEECPLCKEGSFPYKPGSRKS
ncbi:MAG TPA: orotate phosphoribosyltransferase [Bacillota bacterium]|nr:MAG: Orotate phosphoribosyltransferase [Firmicutes bacterium ADurb.Bin153]HNV34327.1 orotate phosphoribosyltransferase [Bacillota bacterium]